MGMSTNLRDTEPAPDNQFMSQLNELKVRNYALEKLTEQLNIKLAEVTATHSKFISIIAHDLRSPFHGILGSLELLKMKLEQYPVDDLQNYINMAADSAHTTLHLLDDLLDWTISQNREKNFHPVKLNLKKLTEGEIAGTLFMAQQKQLSINHSIAPDINVSADLQMVRTILRNLINNAIKYTNPEGIISIGASEGKRFVKITVKDNGIGISKEIQKRLFNMESLHSTSGTNNEHGSGFGLILCKEFVEIHGGSISIESEPGIGSRLMFTLPHYI
jgi:signal transduction histidine kinase